MGHANLREDMLVVPAAAVQMAQMTWLQQAADPASSEIMLVG